MKKTILVSGSTGQLGSELKAISHNYPQFKFHFKNRIGLDLSDPTGIENELAKNYDYFINAGAYTQVDKAEEDAETCFKINATALDTIAKKAPLKTKIIHVSTDYVYNLNTENELQETDNPEAKGVYAESKLTGESELLKNRPDSIVIRTSWVYSVFGHNFVKTMLKLGKIKDKLSIVGDQIGAPTYAFDIAHVIMQIVSRVDKEPENKEFQGVFNFSNGGRTNWAEYAKEIFSLENIICEVSETTTETYGAPAHRPLWSVMDTHKIQNIFGIEIQPWKKSLNECLKRLK